MGETHSEFCIVQKKGSKHKVCLDSVRPPGIFFWCMFLNGGGGNHIVYKFQNGGLLRNPFLPI